VLFPAYSHVSPEAFGKYRLSHNEGIAVGVGAFVEVIGMDVGVVVWAGVFIIVENLDVGVGVGV
jgi:hypothetical protein